jgi:hypothetical protein
MKIVTTHNIAAKNTPIQEQKLRKKNEIKFLYKKKQQFNRELYHLHTENAKAWKHTWNSRTIDKSKITRRNEYDTPKNSIKKYATYPNHKRKRQEKRTKITVE